MHLISLDEQGEFEKIKSSGAKFIAGCIYDDREDSYDNFNERKRVIQYYRAVCDTAGCVFPKDLHFCTDSSGKNNAYAVKQVKTEVAASITEFLKYGTYRGKELLFWPDGITPQKRIGQYYIYSLVKSRCGKQELLGEGISLLVRDDAASNLYVHMAESLINRLLFHNPIIRNMKKAALELATRQAVTNQSDAVKDLKALGYKVDYEHSKGESTHFYLTGADIYRTAIEREMIRTGKSQLQFEKISSFSISYKERGDNSYEKFAFLYLADSICTILGFGIDKMPQDHYLEEIHTRASGLVSPFRTITISYDSFDDYYQKSLDALERHDYFDAIEAIYDGMHIKNKDSIPFYEKIWIPVLWQQLQTADDENAFQVTLSKFQNLLLSNRVDQEEYLFVFDHLKEMDFIRKESIRPELLYLFYDTGISVFTHIGNSKMAMEYFEKCCSYAKYIGIETYLNTRNRIVVLLLDDLQYEKALEIARDNEMYYKELTELKEMLFETDEVHTQNHAKALSQLGQAYAYSGMEEAEECFIRALDMFEKGTINYLITLSYLLHFYLDQKKREKFEKFAIEYFGNNKDPEDQLKYILEESTKGWRAMISMKYALYIFIKGVYTFYLDEVDNRTLSKIRNIENTIRSYGDESARQLGNHPWEIIYKYIALINLSQNKKSAALSDKENIRKSIAHSGPILDLIMLNGERTIEQEMGNTTDELDNQIRNLLDEKFDCQDKNPEDILRYMYD